MIVMLHKRIENCARSSLILIIYIYIYIYILWRMFIVHVHFIVHRLTLLMLIQTCVAAATRID